MVQTLYFISSSIGIIAMIPQVRRLVETKSSDDLSLTTWGIWACCQMISFAYAISIQAKAYMIVNVVWITFYWLMVALIIKYRKRRSLLEVIATWWRRGKEKSIIDFIPTNLLEKSSASKES